MSRRQLLAGVVAMALVGSLAVVQSASADAPAALNFKMKNIAGKEVDLGQYKGKVMLVVNVASRCGLTPQYVQLEALHEKYGAQGLSVVGFPCNQFGKQEPGTEVEISEFCTKKYNVKFDMMSKIDVNGDEACAFYKHLTALQTQPVGAGKISWNFEKFLIGRNGEVVGRFGPRVKPDAPEVIAAIEAELAKK